MRFHNLLSSRLFTNRFYELKLCKKAGYSLCAIEFDDQGELWDPRQLDQTIAHIQHECKHSQGHFLESKDSSVRVGNLSCTEVLFRIIRAVKSKNNGSQCIFVGHSFGGLIIENAICKALLGAMFLNEGEETDSPSDLVVLINPACEASMAKQFSDILRRNKVIVEMGGNTTRDGLTFPIHISITSESDKATKYAFPFGQFFVNLPKSYRKYDRSPDGLPSQRRLNSHTAGHIPYFHNFEVQPISNGDINKDKLEFSFNDGKCKYRIVPHKDRRNTLPFWVMQAPTDIVPNHSDIFTEGLENMLSALLHWAMTSVEPTMLKCNADEQSVPRAGGTEYTS